MLTKWPELKIHGVDLAPKMIELAKENNPAASFDILDIRQINTLKTSYDGIICGFCLPYLSQNDGVILIADCSRLMNNNGLLYLSFVEGDPAKSKYQLGGSGHRMYFNFYELNDLIHQLINNQFVLLKTFKIDYQKSENEIEVHTVLIAKKNQPLVGS
jgi:predicted TPR repeat methyltransferase